MASLDRLDDDGDSAMHSNPEDEQLDLYPAADEPTTPRVAPSELSPPRSRGRGLFDEAGSSSMPSSNQQVGADVSALNENGKRSLPMGAGNSKGVQIHPASGYQWEKEEDAPGYGWKNKRASEDANRSWELIQDKDRMIGTRYGDVLKPASASTAAI